MGWGMVLADRVDRGLEGAGAQWAAEPGLAQPNGRRRCRGFRWGGVFTTSRWHGFGSWFTFFFLLLLLLFAQPDAEQQRPLCEHAAAAEAELAAFRRRWLAVRTIPVSLH